MPSNAFKDLDPNASVIETAAVTPNDSTDLTVIPRGLWIGVGGDVCLLAMGDTSEVTLKNVPTGSYLPVRAKRVKATNTTATNIIAWY
jgi:hypothetical protein